ncbi:MAG: sterol desaturase family protein [Chloroflexaceae bacterium]|nr:sterol desaturase family protein [Chloroflexaceae bacterium]
MQAIVAFVLSILVCSFLEYWIHRIMHLWPWFGGTLTDHYLHHQRNNASGMLREFKNYSILVPVVSAPFFFVSQAMGLSMLAGTTAYAIFAAYAHQLQHENPITCFWQPMPVHYVHHRYNQWHHNYGIALDWWDRIFGTYQFTEWRADDRLPQPEQAPWQLKFW